MLPHLLTAWLGGMWCRNQQGDVLNIMGAIFVAVIFLGELLFLWLLGPRQHDCQPSTCTHSTLLKLIVTLNLIINTEDDQFSLKRTIY